MFYELSTLNVALLFLAMFSAGFVDAIAGGGGLIQTPAMLLSFPDRNPVSVVATSKTAAFFGTSTAAIKKGSGFVRVFYLIVTALLILRLGYSLYIQ